MRRIWNLPVAELKACQDVNETRARRTGDQRPG